MWLKIAEIALLAALAADLLLLLILCAKEKAAEKEIKKCLGKRDSNSISWRSSRKRKLKERKKRP